MYSIGNRNNVKAQFLILTYNYTIMKTIENQFSRSSGDKIRILSLDGGGIRGILPAMMLSYMEKALQLKSGNPDARISDYFDFIAGTSTGGLLTAALLTPDPQNPSRPKLTAKQATDIYLNEGGRIFSRSIWKRVRSMFSMVQERYNSKQLQKSLKKAIGEETLLSKLIKPCMITAYDIFDRKAIFFASEDAAKDKSKDFKAWETALATSAAPTYFEPVRMRSQGGNLFTLVDGGVFANNPAMCAYTEVQKMQGFFKDFPEPTANDMLIVSMGTGSEKKQYSYHDMKSRGQIGWIRPIIDIFMGGSTNTANYQLEKIFINAHSRSKDNNYYRIDPELMEASKEMDDASRKNLKNLKEAGLKNIENYRDKLDEIVDKLLLIQNIKNRKAKVNRDVA